MELTVFGATGGIGGQVVRQALDVGHHVTAVVRDPARLTVTHPNLRVVTAEVTDPEALVPVLTGRGAVLSGLGPRSRKGVGIASAATRAILRAMDEAGVRRLVVVSAAPLGPPAKNEALVLRLMTPVVRAVLREHYADLAVMEADIRGSSTEWTIVRPPRLTDKPPTGTYRTAIDATVPRGFTISRADTAHAMLAAVADRTTMKQALGVAY
jgi:putative NADH-flavin reductase